MKVGHGSDKAGPAVAGSNYLLRAVSTDSAAKGKRIQHRSERAVVLPALNLRARENLP